MDKKQHKTQKSSALGIAVLLFFVAFANVVVAQSGLYVPSNKPVRDMKEVLPLALTQMPRKAARTTHVAASHHSVPDNTIASMTPPSSEPIL